MTLDLLLNENELAEQTLLGGRHSEREAGTTTTYWASLPTRAAPLHEADSEQYSHRSSTVTQSRNQGI